MNRQINRIRRHPVLFVSCNDDFDRQNGQSFLCGFMKSYPLVCYGGSHSFCGGSPTWRPLRPQPGTFLLPPRSGIGLVCGFAATDSRLYYNRLPLVINFSYTQDSRRYAQPQLSVLATVLRFSLIST